ncbi:MAG: glycosyltransferase family A protein [Candidatus Rokuibacteriota bacterium]
MTEPVVTIAIPVYKRLHYLAGAVRSVAAQDYRNIELIVSDNGLNGPAVPEIVNANYSRPWRFRQNPSTETQVIHWNRILSEASGKYFILLADDDEITANYASDLVPLLERHPRASVAIAAQEILDESWTFVRRTKSPLPDRLTGAEFIRAAFHTSQYAFAGFMTTFMRTVDAQRCGGFPDFLMATHSDDTLLFKLCLDREVVLSDRCALRRRIYESSYGLSMTIEQIAQASMQLLRFLDADAQLREYARAHPRTWRELRGYLVRNKWLTHHHRWRHMYRQRLTPRQWVRAAFTLPFIPGYYALVLSTLVQAGARSATNRAKHFAPGAYRLYRRLRFGP